MLTPLLPSNRPQLTLLSRYPVYSLMADYLKLSWAKFSKDVGNHSRQMTLVSLARPSFCRRPHRPGPLTSRAGAAWQVLRTPVPRHGGLIRLLISDPAARRGEEDAIELLAPLPELDLNLGLHTVGWDLWPLFKVLSLDHVLAVLEIALSKEGKVVLVSAYPGLLGSCVLVRRSSLPCSPPREDIARAPLTMCATGSNRPSSTCASSAAPGLAWRSRSCTPATSRSTSRTRARTSWAWCVL